MNAIQWFHQRPLGFKVQAAFLTLGLGATLITTLWITNQFEHSIIESANARLQGIANLQANQAENYLKSLQTEIEALSESQGIVERMAAFDATFNAEGASSETLFKAYATNKNDAPVAGTDYGKLHTNAIDEYSHFITNRGYYDLFLIDLEGNVVLTVAKEADFAQNLNTNGSLKASGLAEAYKGALASGFHMTDFAAYAPSNNIPASFLATQIKDKAGNVIGVLGLQVSVTALSNSVNTDQGMGETGDVFLMGKDGTYRSISRFDKKENEVVLKKSVPELYQKAEKDAESIEGRNRDMNMMAALSSVDDSQKLGWKVVAEQGEAEVLDAVQQAHITALIAFLVVGAACWFVSAAVAKMVKKPFNDIKEALDQLQEGHTDIELKDKERTDEIGAMHRAMAILCQQLAQRKVMMDNLRKLAAHLEGSVNSNMKELTEELQQLDNMAAEMQKETDANMHGVVTVSESTQQMSIAATEISQQVGATSNQATQATSQTEAAQETVGRLFETAEDISNVINIIREITEQTKLLALNAHIEASRAGDAGRGFSVVANQVKDLARQTAKATDDITTKIESLQKAVKQSSNSFNIISNSISEVSNASQSMAAAVEEQTVTLQDISQSLSSVSHDSEQLKQHADSINNSSHRVTSCVTDMNKNLTEFVEQLKQLS
jgi:methyl-accepting chemotaxis protein